MKRFLALFLCIITPLIFTTACSKQPTLDCFVSELRSEIFQGECSDFTVKAVYGFKETPSVSDGKVEQKIYSLQFKLIGKDTSTSLYSIAFNFNQKDYRLDFSFNPALDCLTSSVEIEDFNLKEFTVNIINGSNKTQIDLKSIVPLDAMDYSTALKKLQENQSQLLSNYADQNGNFCAEIHMRILVKKDIPYWYVGLINQKGNLKALLIDGFSGETLAIREIF